MFYCYTISRIVRISHCTNIKISPINFRTLEDGEGEFDPLLDDEDDDEENMGRRNSRPGIQGGYNLLYIGSLKVSFIPRMLQSTEMGYNQGPRLCELAPNGQTDRGRGINATLGPRYSPSLCRDGQKQGPRRGFCELVSSARRKYYRSPNLESGY